MCFILAFELIHTEKECSGADTNKGILPNIEACATACAGSAEMFIYGAFNEWEEKRGEDYQFCFSNGCMCSCEDDTKDYRCETIKNLGFDLYAFKKDNGNKFCNSYVCLFFDLWITNPPSYACGRCSLFHLTVN